MSRLSGLSTPAAPVLWRHADRGRVALGSLLLGAIGSVALAAFGASPATVAVPLSFGVLGALATCPFPSADRWLAIGVLGTLPLLPPVGLPNLPLAAAVLPIALVRVVWDGGIGLDRRVVVALAVLWASIAIGAGLSHWPAPTVWLRPVALLGLAALASILGALVWRDPARRARWLDGLSIGLLIVAVSGLVVFTLQYLIPIRSIVEGLTASLEFLRGEGAAAKFEDQNNWVIWGQVLTLRAFSPIFPAPTNTGGFIGIVAPIVAAHWIIQANGPWRRVAGVALLTAAIIVLVSLSRSTWFAAGVAVIAGVAIVVGYGRLRRLVATRYARRLATLVAIAVLGVGIGVVGIFSVGTEASADRITGALDDPSVTTRIDIDRGAAEAFNADVLRGAGLGNWDATLEVRTGKAYVHNVFLEYAAATGVFGLAWAVLLVVLILGSAILVIGRAVDPANVVLGLGLLLVGVFTTTQFMFDDNLLNPQYAWLLLWVVGGSLTLAASTAVVSAVTARDGGGPITETVDSSRES